jgi:hypothetical protein
MAVFSCGFGRIWSDGAQACKRKLAQALTRAPVPGPVQAALDFCSLPRHGSVMTAHIPLPQPVDQTSFDRRELQAILSLYGRMVAAGEWRDYGISALRDVAVFCVFRRTAEHPLYRIEKRPALRNRQGMYAVIAMDGQVLKRGQDLEQVLRVLERKLLRIVTE